MSHFPSHGHPVPECWSCCVSFATQNEVTSVSDGSLRAIPRCFRSPKQKTFIVLLGIQLGIHRLEPNTEDPLWPEVSRRPFCCKELLSPGSMHIAPPVAFGLKQAIEEEVTVVLPAIRELSVSDDPATLLCFLRSHRHYRQRALRRPLTAEPIREAIERFVTARVPAFESPSVINIGVTVP